MSAANSTDNHNQSQGNNPLPETAVGASDFRSLVENSTVIVDKSLLIKQFLSYKGETLLITYPRRWGKTINMNMIKTFLELEVDEQGKELPQNQKKNRNIFAEGKWDKGKKVPLNIWHEKDIVDEHFGKYPVISVSFKDVRGNSYEDIRLKVIAQISKLYEQHRYLLNSDYLQSNHKNKINEYIEGSANIADLEGSLKNLCEYLNKHFDKKAFVLIDEYDTPINHANLKFMIQTEIDDVLELFRGVLGGALKENKYLERGLVTGILRIAKADLFSGVNNFTEYNILDREYGRYYGFTEAEIDELLKAYEVPVYLKQEIKNWYNGYNAEGLEIYNPWSIVKCLAKFNSYKDVNGIDIKDKILQSYWEESGNVNFVKGLFKTEVVQENVEKLIDQKPIDFDLIKQLSVDDFSELRNLTNLGSNYSITSAGVNLLFSYLFFAGYLTIHELPASFRVPNNEIRKELATKLLQYYQAQYTIDMTLFRAVTDKVQIILDSRLSTANLGQLLEDFKLSLTKLLKSFPDFSVITHSNITEPSDKVTYHGNEDLIHSVLNYIVLQVRTLTKFATEISVGSGRADIALIDAKNNCAAIIELKYNQTADIALEQISERDYAKDIVGGFKTILLGVNVLPDKTVEVKYRIAGGKEFS